MVKKDEFAKRFLIFREKGGKKEKNDVSVILSALKVCLHTILQ